jgi:hypothetical protein
MKEDKLKVEMTVILLKYKTLFNRDSAWILVSEFVVNEKKG